jgi:hypothetical protein
VSEQGFDSRGGDLSGRIGTAEHRDLEALAQLEGDAVDLGSDAVPEARRETLDGETGGGGEVDRDRVIHVGQREPERGVRVDEEARGHAADIPHPKRFGEIRRPMRVVVLLSRHFGGRMRLLSPGSALVAVSLALSPLVSGCFKYEKPLVTVSEDPSAGAFPNELFSEVLEGRVSEDGLIDYKAIAADREKLDRFTGYIARVSPEADPALFPTKWDKMAYYINTYNALAIRGVIDRPGLKSVDDIKVEYFFYTRYNIGGKKLDLYRLENSVIRPMFNDPRVHFALNCQSGGCPIFPQTAFLPEGLDAFLDEQTVRFVNHPEKVRPKKGAEGVWEISQIFEWYAKDFEDAGGAAAFIHKYREEVPADAKIEYIPYDWKLIAQEGKAP